MSDTGQTAYWRAHEAVKEIHGPASLHDCSFCGEDARDWAYNHKDPDEKIAQFNGCAYSTDPSCYIPLCRSCHLEFDSKYRRVQQFEDLPADLTERQRGAIENQRPRRGKRYKSPGLGKIEPEDLSLFIIRTVSRAFDLGGISEELDKRIDMLVHKARRAGVVKGLPKARYLRLPK